MGTKGLTKIYVLVLVGMVVGTNAASASSHDVAWTFGNVSFLSYRLDSFSPADAGLGAAIGTQNPTLTLQLGWRYRVTITNYTAHPFEVLAKGPSAGTDTVLLAMGSVLGSFESDPDVAWVDDGSGTVKFTMTYALYLAMTGPGHIPGYRCRPHASTMRGNFVIEGLPIAERIQKGSVSVELEEVVTGLAAPIDLTSAPDETGKLYVVDQAGKVFIIFNGELMPVAFLDVTDRMIPLGVRGTGDENDYDERGLLGFAFHPGFADMESAGYRKVYTYTSEPNLLPADFTTDPALENINHQSVIAEWMVDSNNPDIVDPNSYREILRIDQPQFNHNGGMLAFGPDEYLYIALGDGGASNDTGDGHGEFGNGQNINTIHGSIARIDPLEPLLTPDSNDPVSASGNYRIPLDNPFVGVNGVDEIFAYGFRNPFRFSFDPETGDLIAADVGQNNVEEIDIVYSGGNYGWNLKEGSFGFDPDTGDVLDNLVDIGVELIDPVAEYDHDDGISIIGGYVYRGQAIPELSGKYIFGDFSLGFGSPTGRLFYADLEAGLIQELTIGKDDRPLNLYVKGFGRDAAGQIYVLAGSNLGPFGSGGVVLKIVGLPQDEPSEL
jgi:glucose/arabinose dehydrogenase